VYAVQCFLLHRVTKEWPKEGNKGYPAVLINPQKATMCFNGEARLSEEGDFK